MEDLFLTLTNHRPSEVKIVLASALAALAAWQVGLMLVGWGWVKVPFLAAGPASKTHRAIGDALVVLTLFASAVCVSLFGFEAEEAEAHVPVALALLAVFACKVAFVRWLPRLSFLLPWLGIALFVLFVATWATAAAPHLV